MKKALFITNLILTVLSVVAILVITIAEIVVFSTNLTLLMPFVVAFCYISLCVSVLSVVLNFVTYSLLGKNKMLTIALISLVVSIIAFILSMLV